MRVQGYQVGEGGLVPPQWRSVPPIKKIFSSPNKPIAPIPQTQSILTGLRAFRIIYNIIHNKSIFCPFLARATIDTSFISAFLFFKTHIRVLLDHVGS